MKNTINLKSLDRMALKEWLNLYDTIITDCDGVLWHDHEEIPQVSETINILKSLGKNIYFVTNNSTKTRQELWLKATAMNYLIDDESHIISPTYCIAEHLKQHLSKNDQVYVIGSSAITQELNNLNIKNFGTGEDLVEKKWTDQLENIKRAAECEKVAAVVVGFDQHFSFMKMLKACSYLSSNPHCDFLATNADAVHKYSKYCIPGTGAILATLQTCLGKDAKLMGKPNPLICENIIKSGKMVAKKTLMIGDCAKIDVIFGKNCGFNTLLVGTGYFKWSKVQILLENNNTDFIPDYYIDSLADLLPYLK